MFFCAGFNLSPQAMNIVMKRYSTNGRIGFDDFMSCCIRLRGLTGEWGEECMNSETVGTLLREVDQGLCFNVFLRSFPTARHNPSWRGHVSLR